MRTHRLLALVAAGSLAALAEAAHTNNILLTGYWPPTNNMIRRFSTNPEQNAQGWIGGNWEGRGYNIYSYFPEFPNGLNDGVGDFRVDYQATSADWWRITAQLQPVAIIAFGRAEDNFDWRVEGASRNLPLDQWADDYVAPLRPTPDLPIYSETPGRIRASSLPMQQIVDAVTLTVPGATTYSTTLDTSNFLCDFIGYHANWYHDLHANPDDPAWNVASGFIHVGSMLSTVPGRRATEASLRALTDYVDTVVPEPSAALLVVVGVMLLRRRAGR